jgi:putative iron-regulated protein
VVIIRSMNRHILVSRTARIAAGALIGTLLLAGCGSDSDSSSSGSGPTTTAGKGAIPPKADFTAVATTYADLAAAEYAASIASAKELQTAIKDFVAAPSDATLKAAKDQWLAARNDYGITEAFRLYDGPIDDPETGPEGLLNAWPLDEAYIDSVAGNANAGIINDTAAYPEITADVLVEANEKDGETNISTGWHAVEFLLWGQDTSATGPGNRPVTDYTSAKNADRRGQYLQLAADGIVANLEDVAAEWDADNGAYRKAFIAEPVDAVQKIMRGIGALSAGELAGERISVALDTKDQEDEHSCFSDNTAADVALNAKGIQIVYLADFDGVSGMSVSDLVKKIENLPATFETMIAAAEDDPNNEALVAVRDAVEQQGTTISNAAKALGLEISITV